MTKPTIAGRSAENPISLTSIFRKYLPLLKWGWSPKINTPGNRINTYPRNKNVTRIPTNKNMDEFSKVIVQPAVFLAATF